MNIFSYLIEFGAPVMMPVIFTILGVVLGNSFKKSLHSGLYVGVGFIGLSIITALLTSAMGPALSIVVKDYGLELEVFDMGWPASAAVAYNTAIGSLIIPVCLGINILMLLTRTTKTVNIDIWNYWHFAFIGAIVYFATGSVLWGFFAAIICYIITLVAADIMAKPFQKFYKDFEGISIPQPFCVGFIPFAWGVNKLLDTIPGINKIDIDAEGMKKKFGLFGEPLFLGVIVGIVIGIFAKYELKGILLLGVQMGAVLELIPRITTLFIEGLRPISEAAKTFIAKRFKNSSELYIGMTPALVIGHPVTLVVSILLIPTIILLSFLLPGNKFLPLASLAGMFYLFPLVLPITKGNVFKTFMVGLVSLVVGVYLTTNLAGAFTLAAQDVYKLTQDPTVRIPAEFSLAAALDFASSILSWGIYHLTVTFKWIGSGILVLFTGGLLYYNRKTIVEKNKITKEN